MAATFYNQNGGGRFDTREKFSDKPDHDKPAFSRVFVVCGKQHTTEDLRDTFKESGTIEDIWIVKDRTTKENRGLAYIKFSKMSEACMAIETMNGQKLSEDDDGPRLKVIMAQPKSSKSKEDFDDDTALTRLFVLVPKGTDENELREAFQQFGDIDYVSVVKDRNTGEKKGFGYVKYHRAYDAAKALEDADRNFKAVMAEPKSAAKKKRELAGSEVGSLGGNQGSIVSNPEWGFGVNRGIDNSSSMHQLPSMPSFGFNDGNKSAIGNRLQVNCAHSVSAEQLARLFNLIPGMELCDLKRNFSTGESKGVAVVVYNSVGSATYAKEKLHGFEYPPGFKLTVQYAPTGESDMVVTQSKDMGAVGGIINGGSVSALLCNVPLPPAKPILDSKTDECAERLFIVCQPSPPPQNVLSDVFSRFGDLIAVFMLKNKNFGYAKYASAEAAEKAMQTLHGAEVYGCKLKVLMAEPPKTAESARKRPRT